MRGKIFYMMQQADLTALCAVVGRAEDDATIVVDAIARAVFVGSTSVGERITFTLAAVGRETPRIDVGRLYLLLLRMHGAYASLVDATEPLPVDESQVPAVSSILRAFACVAVRPDEPGLRACLVQALRADVGFLRIDAARTVADCLDWPDRDLDALAARLTGEDGASPLAGDAADEVLIALVGRAPAARAAAFARARLERGDVDPVYYGLLIRADAVTNTILRDLLADPDLAVQTGALRVAGLLGASELVDAFQIAPGTPDEPARRAAVAEARALLERD